MEHRRQSLKYSFRHAFDGLIYTIKRERNIKIHLFIMTLVILCGFFFKISTAEWCICFALFGLVISLELVNTAIESVVDLVTQEWKELARDAKDAAAGAVLVSAVMSAIAGLIIFVPKLLAMLP